MFGSVLFSLLLAVVTSPLPGSAGTGATWDLDEPSGARVAADSSGNGHDGSVGADVVTGVVHGGAIGYRFADVAPNSPPTRPGHLVTVPHSPQLDPDDGDFTVTVRFRTTRTPGNVVQKGQNGEGGGYWKIEQDDGRARCAFVGGDGQGRSVAADVRVDDGRWHTVVCERTADGVSISVDDAAPKTRDGATGPIRNTADVVIGGKADCDQRGTGCDYFSGDIDFVRIEKG